MAMRSAEVRFAVSLVASDLAYSGSTIVSVDAWGVHTSQALT
jgi:hypothetical protein